MPLSKFAAWFAETFRGKPPAVPQESAVPKSIYAKPAKKAGNNPGRDLILSGRAPDDLAVPCLDLTEVTEPFQLPARLQCFELKLARSSVQTLPPGIQVSHRIDLTGCAALQSLPGNLRTGSLLLQDCTALTALPENLAVHFLVLDGCRALSLWPETARVTLGHVSARRCTVLSSIPASLGPITSLDLSGCDAIRSIPAGVQVSSWMDIKGTGVREIPESLQDVDLR